MKTKPRNAAELDQAILDLEAKAKNQKRQMQEAFEEVSESLKPMNLVKSGMRTIFSGENKFDIVNGLIGLGTGILSRKLLIGKSSGVVKKTLGKAVQWGMAGIVSKNAEKIKEKAGEIIDRLFKKKSTNHVPVPPTTGEKISKF